MSQWRNVTKVTMLRQTYVICMLRFEGDVLASTHQPTVCSAQTRTGIGLLGKPPAVKQFPQSKATRRNANAGMKRTSVVEHNLNFARLAIVG